MAENHIYNDKWDITPANADDIDEIIKVSKLCSNYSRGFDPLEKDVVVEWLSNKESEIFLCKDNDSVLAYLMAQVYQRQNGKCLWVRMIGTHPDFQRKGIAKALLSHSFNWGKDLGASQSFLATDVENDNALNLYKRLGYSTSEDYEQINMIKVS